MSTTSLAAPLLVLGLSSAFYPCDLLAQADRSDSRPDDPADSSKGSSSLKMSKAVACRSIDGYEQYEPLPGGALTAEEKLQIYYRPINYKTAQRGNEFVLHFTQDGQIRRKGEKAVLRRKKNILDYEGKSRQPVDWIFLRNSVPLKGLPPGEYEYDITLRDENNPGTTASQSVSFRIVPPGIPPATKESSKEKK
jgi:hypothetical protein